MPSFENEFEKLFEDFVFPGIGVYKNIIEAKIFNKY